MKRLTVQMALAVGVLVVAASPTAAQYYSTPSSLKAVTGPASNVATSSATLNGVANAACGAASFSFQVGLAAGNYTSQSSPSAVFGCTDQNVAAALTGLAPGTTYHYRLTVSANGTTVVGADATFTTPGTPPSSPPTTVPVPVPVPVTRTTPDKVTVTASPKSDPTPPFTFTFSGVIDTGGSSRSLRAASACSGGKVSIQIKRGRKTVSTRRANVGANCRWHRKVSFHASRRLGKHGRLTVRTRFLGSDALKPKNAKTIHVRYGHK